MVESQSEWALSHRLQRLCSWRENLSGSILSITRGKAKWIDFRTKYRDNYIFDEVSYP